jgi:hypothetical protein
MLVEDNKERERKKKRKKEERERKRKERMKKKKRLNGTKTKTKQKTTTSFFYFNFYFFYPYPLPTDSLLKLFPFTKLVPVPYASLKTLVNCVVIVRRLFLSSQNSYKPDKRKRWQTEGYQRGTLLLSRKSASGFDRFTCSGCATQSLR